MGSCWASKTSDMPIMYAKVTNIYLTNMDDHPVDLSEAQRNQIKDGETETESQIENELSCLKDVTKLVGYQLGGVESWWACNKYNIEDENGDTVIGMNEEESQPAIVRALCSNNRPYFMNVVDCSTKENILEFERLMRCCSPILCPWSRSTLIIRDRRAEILGYVKHAPRETCVSWFGPSVYYEIADAACNLQFIILGPGGCVVECKKPNIFRVMTPDLSRKVGEIFHEWRGCCGGSFSFFLSHDVDHFTLKVDAEVSPTNKALLLGALMLAHFNYMEVL